MSFEQRVLKFTFSGDQVGTLGIQGLRAAANIQVASGKTGVNAQVKIWGLTLAQMDNYSSRISAGPALGKFNAVIEAGVLGGPLSTVINGPIIRSYVDLGSVPESAFVVSIAGLYEAANPNPGQSFKGPYNAEDVISALCAGTYTVVNNGAHAVLRNPNVTADSIINQVLEIANHAGFRVSLATTSNTISIWPKNGTIDNQVIDLGPSTDPELVGYPTFTETGLIVTSLYNPEIFVGRNINLKSSIPKANGLWQIVYAWHDLTTMIPKGPWFTSAMLASAGT